MQYGAAWTLDEATGAWCLTGAPYCLVDQKACVRWLKYNIALGNLCGDAERIISTGGSGGAHSLMPAATGNRPDFYPYLEEWSIFHQSANWFLFRESVILFHKIYLQKDTSS